MDAGELGIAAVGVIVPLGAALYTANKSRDITNVNKLAELSAARQSLGDIDDVDFSGAVALIDHTIRVLAAKVAFAEFGRSAGRRHADSTLPWWLKVPLIVTLVLYLAGVGLTMFSWSNATWADEHQLFGVSFSTFAVTLFAGGAFLILLELMVLNLWHDDVARKFESSFLESAGGQDVSTVIAEASQEAERKWPRQRTVRKGSKRETQRSLWRERMR